MISFRFLTFESLVDTCLSSMLVYPVLLPGKVAEVSGTHLWQYG
jgi:hypothetical protein